jgi:hypothetical protein
MEKFNAIKNAILAAEPDAVKFYTKGNNTAGTRLRASMQAIKSLAQDIRKEVSEIRGSEATKTEETPAE